MSKTFVLHKLPSQPSLIEYIVVPSIPSNEDLLLYRAAQDDPSKPIKTRGLQVNWGGWIADYAVFRCPVREEYALAFLDKEGRYWVDHMWVAGGNVVWSGENEFNRYSDGTPVQKTPRPSGQSVPLAAAGETAISHHDGDSGLLVGRVAYTSSSPTGYPVFGQDWRHGDWSNGSVAPWSYARELGYWGHRYESGRPSYDETRAYAMWVFDQEWGSGAFVRSIRAARARHTHRLRMNRYRANAMQGRYS